MSKTKPGSVPDAVMSRVDRTHMHARASALQVQEYSPARAEQLLRHLAAVAEDPAQWFMLDRSVLADSLSLEWLTVRMATIVDDCRAMIGWSSEWHATRRRNLAMAFGRDVINSAIALQSWLTTVDVRAPEWVRRAADVERTNKALTGGVA